MSYVLTTPEMLAAAATDVGNIGSAISTASSNAAGPTAGVLPPAAHAVMSKEQGAAILTSGKALKEKRLTSIKKRIADGESTD